jgi:hypothetical protein
MSADMLAPHGTAKWRVRAVVDKYEGCTDEEFAAGAVEPTASETYDGNILVYGGVSLIWQALIGNGGAGALAYFNNANAHIGVGASATAAAATQTDLITTPTRRPMAATYPQHTDATTAGAATITFQAVFGNADANIAWNEWGLANAATGGRLLNRKVEAMGTKTSTAVWTMTVTLTIS